MPPLQRRPDSPSSLPSACQILADNLVYVEGVMGDLVGMLLEVGLLARAEGLEPGDLRERLSAIVESFEGPRYAMEVPRALHDSLGCIDVIVSELATARIDRVAPPTAPDLVRGEERP